MLTPGVFKTRIKVHSLKRISPSRYHELKLCALREALAAARVSPYLPSSPAARLGSVIHLLLEESGNGRLPPDENKIVGRWEELIMELEAKLQADWLDSACVPLSKTVREFDVKRLRAIRKAFDIATSRQKQLPGARPGAQHELWVQTSDGLIGGAIDCVIQTENGPVIRDYKSGQIFDGLEIKSDYKTQLKLYAALYAKTCGRWPLALEIEPLTGNTVKVDYSIDECEILLKEATRDLQQINELIQALECEDTLSSRMVEIASPSPQNCLFCRYRPICGPYLACRTQQADTDWSADLVGQLTEIRRLNNGRLFLTVSNAVGAFYVRGITDSTERHPALAQLRIGDRSAVFNLLRTPSVNTFSESSQTIIYKYEMQE